MAFIILSINSQIRMMGLTKTSATQARNLRTLFSFRYGQINGHCTTIKSKFSTCTSQSLDNPGKQLMRTRCMWFEQQGRRQLPRVNSPSASFASQNFFHSSSICKSEQENFDGDTSANKNDGKDEENSTTENLSEEDRHKKLTELKQRFKTLLDDAESQKPAADEFDFSDIPQEKVKVTKDGVGPTKPKINPSERTVLLFPGQGAQFVGMGKELLNYPVVKEMYDVASEILGYDLLALCLEGPKDDLDRTVHCQPAVLVTSLAAVEKLKHENIKAIENCAATAGFSVGEYSALVFGGVISFEDAITLIKVRAEAMQRASDKVASGMLSVIGGRQTQYKQMCAEAAKYCQENLKMERPVCRVANYLFQNVRVVAGHNEALEFIMDMKQKYHLRSIKRLPVSGAFHTPLMAPAKDALTDAIENINFEEPLIDIHANTNGKAYRHTNYIREQLCNQVVEPVLWEQTMAEIYNRTKGTNFPQTFEIGPGKQLGAMLQRFNGKAFQSYYKVDV